MEESPDDNDNYNEEDPVEYSDDLEDQEQPPSQEEVDQSEVTADPEISKTSLSQTESIKPVPKISDLVNTAILQLKERKGSTVESILAFLVKKYKIDPDKSRKNVRGYLKRALARGSILQTGGEGNNSTYKLSPATKAEIMKGNRVTPAKGRGRPAAKTSGTSKRQKDISAMAAVIKRKTSLNANVPMATSKRGGATLNAGQSKRMKTQMNEDLFDDDSMFDAPKPGKGPTGIMKAKRGLGKRGNSALGLKKGSKT